VKYSVKLTHHEGGEILVSKRNRIKEAINMKSRTYTIKIEPPNFEDQGEFLPLCFENVFMDLQMTSQNNGQPLLSLEVNTVSRDLGQDEKLLVSDFEKSFEWYILHDEIIHEIDDTEDLIEAYYRFSKNICEDCVDLNKIHCSHG
jgi:hypothetical protein